jgi:HTH-type transcriptional regulator/antitoxin HigA
MKTKLNFKDMPSDYQGLFSRHAVRPIHDRVEYDNALEVLDALSVHDLNPDQEDYFEALALLVQAYETAHLPGIAAKNGISVLKHLLEENSMSGADLSRLLGTDRSLGVRILNGERNLTLDHVKKLAARFRLPAEVFIR